MLVDFFIFVYQKFTDIYYYYVIVKLKGVIMGYYIQGPVKGKAQYLVNQFGAKRIENSQIALHMKHVETSTDALICVVDNGMFEAAGYAFDYEEFKAFTLPSDPRPKEFLLMDKSKVHELTGYKERG